MRTVTVKLSEEVNDRLTAIARKRHISKAEAMRRSFALLSVADQETDKGNFLGVVPNDCSELGDVRRVLLGFDGQ